MSSVSTFYKLKSTHLALFRFFTISGRTPHIIYAFHRFLFRLTNGLWNDVISAYLSVVNRKYAQITETDSILGKMSDSDVESIVSDLDKNGYCIFKQKLSEEMIKNLTEFSLNTPVRYLLPVDSYSKQGIIFSQTEHLPNEVKDKSARLQHDTSHLLKNLTLQKLIFDSNILKIAQGYLKCKPILDLVVMWWSYPVKEKNKFASAAAQKFHFDMDRFKFLKFFFYLTDVDAQTGPHCFVKGSHKKLPSMFRKRGRFEDEDVINFYKSENVLEICGSKGTIMAVDTRGLHKGKILETGNRLLFQIEFSNSLFGEFYEKRKLQKRFARKGRIYTKPLSILF